MDTPTHVPIRRKYAFWGIGLAILNAVAIYIRHVREGKRVEPSTEGHEELENHEQLMAVDTDEELITPHDAAAADSSFNEVATDHCPDFNIIHQQSASAIPRPDGLINLVRISTPGSGFRFTFGCGAISTSTAWF